MALERLQKIISRSGMASRRQAEEWILAGRIMVNGAVVRELGSKADPDVAHIKVDGKRLQFPSRLVYLALHKPHGYITTRSDPQGRPTVMDLLKGVKERVYPVGRLDYHSEGLLLLTNDGDFANHIITSASAIPKTYQVKVTGSPAAEQVEKLRQGIVLDGRKTLPARIRLLPQGESRSASNRHYEVILLEGRQNQLRRMFARIGHPVKKLKRVRIGGLELGSLPPGKFRPLTPAEVAAFQKGRATA